MIDWTKYQNKFLEFKTAPDNDNIRCKEIIRKELINNKFILHALNNSDLEQELEEDGTGADSYYGVNILPYYLITSTQTDVKNFICYEIGYRTSNGAMAKNLQLTFTILCNQQNIVDSETGIARHDLLAALIQDQFNYSSIFGDRIELISDLPSVVDSAYSARTLVFMQIADNNIIKSRKINNTYTPTYVNKGTIFEDADRKWTE